MSALAHPEPAWEGVRQAAKSMFKASRDRGDLTGGDIDVWRGVWPGVSPAGFVQALQAHSRAGNVWMPEAGELAPYMPEPESAVDAAPWAEVLSALDGARFLGRAGAVERMRERVGDLGAAFVCAVGVDALKATDLGGEYGPIAQRDLKARWDEFVRSAEADVRRGLPAPRASDRGELETRRQGLRRLDFGLRTVPELEGGAA